MHSYTQLSFSLMHSYASRREIKTGLNRLTQTEGKLVDKFRFKRNNACLHAHYAQKFFFPVNGQPTK